ncbi:hypothetical protein Val02_78250 [Virgisporangium aliadipatigenens]|uniref:Barstar (barnase inhibitor) domain-containing protein n=1 Tax=Virgisporangium aliadipatigenens TaxID=741659 RepID=A0A8J3YSL4_9ACTN|nr:barstar family protein [Virgisporangium aliadipatigenens]GIJ50939.1 hypothetical protein Val02_78250 [Virgisporangium aliadipatigenens]
MLRSLSANRRLPGPPYVIGSESVDYVVSFARGIQARVVRLEVPPEPDRRGVLRLLGQALGFAEGFGTNWDAWYDCLGDVIETATGGTVVILERSERLLDSPPALFAQLVYHLQTSQDLVAGSARDRLLIEFAFAGLWGDAQTVPIGHGSPRR